MRLLINDILFNLQENDKVKIEEHECGRCECTHREITVTRQGNIIAHFGEYISLHRLDDWMRRMGYPTDEIFGGVVIGRDDNPEPDHIWQTHIIKGFADKTERDYIAHCGVIPKKWDMAVFNKRNVEHLPQIAQDRLCAKCKELAGLK